MKRLRGESGQALTEFAIVLPVLLLLLAGILDFGRILYATMNVNMAAQEAVRLGGLGRSDAAIRQFARDYLHEADPAAVTVAISPGEDARKSGDYVTVTITEPIRYLTPVLTLLLPDPYEVTSASTIRVE